MPENAPMPPDVAQQGEKTWRETRYTPEVCRTIPAPVTSVFLGTIPTWVRVALGQPVDWFRESQVWTRAAQRVFGFLPAVLTTRPGTDYTDKLSCGMDRWGMSYTILDNVLTGVISYLQWVMHYGPDTLQTSTRSHVADAQKALDVSAHSREALRLLSPVQIIIPADLGLRGKLIETGYILDGARRENGVWVVDANQIEPDEVLALTTEIQRAGVPVLQKFSPSEGVETTGVVMPSGGHDLSDFQHGRGTKEGDDGTVQNVPWLNELNEQGLVVYAVNRSGEDPVEDLRYYSLLIEYLQQQHPDLPITVTFLSGSGAVFAEAVNRGIFNPDDYPGVTFVNFAPALNGSFRLISGLEWSEVREMHPIMQRIVQAILFDSGLYPAYQSGVVRSLHAEYAEDTAPLLPFAYSMSGHRYMFAAMVSKVQADLGIYTNVYVVHSEADGTVTLTQSELETIFSPQNVVMWEVEAGEDPHNAFRSSQAAEIVREIAQRHSQK